MQNLANWIQAISTAILASLTVWVVFYSEVGDLAIQLLQSELWETKQEMKVIFDEKEELENQKQRLQDERNELARQREEHFVHVVNGRLGDLWLFGARTLAAYREVAGLSQELLDLTEKVEIYRDWNESNEVASIKQAWMFYLPVPEEISTYKRSDWGELLIDMNYGRGNVQKVVFSLFSTMKMLNSIPKELNGVQKKERDFMWNGNKTSRRNNNGVLPSIIYHVTTNGRVQLGSVSNRHMLKLHLIFRIFLKDCWNGLE